MLASLEAGSRFGGERRGELNPNEARLALHRYAEATLAQDLKHVVVLGLNDRFEDGHAVLVRGFGDSLEEECPEAAALERVRDGEPHFGPIGGGAVVACLADDFAALDGDDAAAKAVFDARPQLGRRRRVEGLGPEAKRPRQLRETVEEGQDGCLVARLGGSDPYGRAVPEDYVDVSG